jgi:hypothetical protein
MHEAAPERRETFVTPPQTYLRAVRSAAFRLVSSPRPGDVQSAGSRAGGSGHSSGGKSGISKLGSVGSGSPASRA